MPERRRRSATTWSARGSSDGGMRLTTADPSANLAPAGARPEPFRQENAMSDFPECVLIVTAEVDAAVEAEWNRWYDTVHLPDALRCPGVQRGRRYVSAG